MNYQHLTFDELVRQCGAQIGNDLELEGELVRRVVAGEIQITVTDDVTELRDEITGNEETISELEAALTKKDEEIEALQKRIDDTADKLNALHIELTAA